MLQQQAPGPDLGAILAAAFKAEPVRSHADCEKIATTYLMRRIAEAYELAFDDVASPNIAIPDTALPHMFTPHGWQILGLMISAQLGGSPVPMHVSVH